MAEQTAIFVEALNYAAEGCMSDVEAYADCVTKNRKTWFKDCEQYKNNLDRCATQSPIIHAIKIECSEGYKLCLRDNPANLYACSKELQAFADCAKDILRKAKTEGQ